MTQTFFWYDLETSGFNPREQRIMQFAGQRTDMDLKPVGEPVNVLLKITDDILPDPDAVLLTGITPQQTISEGISEAEFLKLFYREVATPGTIFAGYNSIRFDDEFMRFLNYRNFYDPYEWQWKDGRGKWDLLDVARMTRALRPDGIKWPFSPDGKSSNRLELLTSANKLNHASAHDALSDVNATIAVARLIKEKQPKLFEFLLKVREKKEVAKLVDTGKSFVYTSGKYPGEFEKTTIAVKLANHPQRSGAALVYDLRHDPAELLAMEPAELAARWQWTRDPKAPPRLPVKTLRYNVCPAVAPLGVLDDESQQRLKIDMKTIEANRAKLASQKDFVGKLQEATEIIDKKRQTSAFANQNDVDGQLYDGFMDDRDKSLLRGLHESNPTAFDDQVASFADSRLRELWPLYKARNFPKILSSEELSSWETYRTQRLMDGGENSRLGRYMKRLQELSAEVTNGSKRYLLEELQLYAESIMPLDSGA